MLNSIEIFLLKVSKNDAQLKEISDFKTATAQCVQELTSRTDLNGVEVKALELYRGHYSELIKHKKFCLKVRQVLYN